MEKVKLYLDGLDCANCAAKIEDKINKLDEVKEASVNFANGTLVMTVNEDQKESIISKVTDIVIAQEPHVKVRKATKAKVSKPAKTISVCNDGCCEEHHHDEINKADNLSAKLKHKEPINNHQNHSSSHGHDHKTKGHTHSHSAHSHGHEEHEHSHEAEEDGHHGHDHEHGGELSKFRVGRIVAAIVLYAIGMIFDFGFYGELGIFLVSYVLAGGDIVLSALKNIKRGEIFDENFLMVLATVGAFAIKEFPEAVAVMLFYQIGEAFQDMAVDRSRKSIQGLMDIRPDYANLKLPTGEEKVDPESIEVGEIIIIKAGERVPLDGIILKGEASIDTSALTGESIPREVKLGDDILSGAINKNGLLEVKVTKIYGESTVAKILDLVENAGNKKAPTEKFITKFARYYTPAVVFAALALAFIPPIVTGSHSFSQWIYRALVFLVVSCPCALVISIPLTFFGGIGAASKQGILIKGGNYLEALNRVKTVVFDKTGTLTKGVFKVSALENRNDFTKDQLLEFAAYAEFYSNHPIAVSIVREYEKTIDKSKIDSFEEISGRGIKIKFDGQEVLAGNGKLMEDFSIKTEVQDVVGTVIHVAVNKKYAGYILIADEVKQDAKEAIDKLREIGIDDIVMLTGDNKKVAEAVAGKLSIKKVYSELLPADKVEKLESIFSSKQEKDAIVFVGDGINDAPVLARADIGIAMGGVGSDAAIEAADVVIMTDEPSKIAMGINIAKRTNVIVWQNIIFALGVKLVILVLGALGYANMWEAVFGDVGVALIAVLNAMRILKVENN
ncbi:cadmium transporter [Clostridium zeae]|uniref:Cd(2+)-exporting ATPase n=1 Tax=Clostridium zeae TaxID=2759022 RepID=A0ABQ1ECP2_9CLOT|nr:heavy metal translocating P-type ATPase [Clostridium zeae]GFZ32547.1 cadmium transporter [Clostridium zeae]